MAEDFAAFARKLDRTTAEFTGSNMKAILGALGKPAAEIDAPKAVAGDLGADRVFTGGRGRGSGWPGARLDAEFSVQGSDVIVRAKSKSIGPWRVAQSGRHLGMSGRMQGPALAGFTTKGKQRSVKGRGRRWNGSTQPMNTWDDAKEIMSKETPRRAAQAVTTALGNVFRG